MPSGGWGVDPHSGGVKISDAVKRATTARIEKHAAAKYAGKYTRLDIRYRGALCYMDAYTEPEAPSEEMLRLRGQTREQALEQMRAMPTHLCRIRFFAVDRWSLAFFAYSSEKYEPSMYPNGEWFGTPEQAFDVGAMYLQ
jgi:hypothetical protein